MHLHFYLRDLHRIQMIRRNSSKTNKRHPLGRSKSMSCVPRAAVYDLVTIEPRNALRDAHIAATLSYERAQTEAAMDELYYHRLSSDLSRQNSPRKDNSAPNNGEDNLPLAKLGPSKLQRRQSVRFAGPSARQPRQLVSNTESLPAAIKAGRRESDNRAFIGRKWRSEGSNQQISSDRPSQSHSHNHPPMLQSISKPVSATSSVSLGGRRLRKSRSMFVPFQISAQETPRNSFDRCEEWLMPYNHDASDRASGRAQSKHIGRLRAPKSMSFLRSNIPKASSSSQSSMRNDTKGLGAQHLFGSINRGDRSLKSHSSMLFLPKSRKETGSGGSLRNSSNNTDPLSSTFSTTHSSFSKPSGFRHVARKASVSLKKKFKGIFKRKKESEDIHGQAFAVGSDHGSLAQTDISAHEEASISRVRSHVPSLHSVPSVRCPHSRRGSLESAEDEPPHTDGERSRVTSWTNSSTNASQITIGECERQRLSVINESGNVNIQTDSRQLPYTNTASRNNQVYSALVKRLDEMNQQQSKDRPQTEKPVMEMCDQNNDLPRNNEEKTSNWRPSTIRCVQDDDDVFRDDRAASQTHIRIPDAMPQPSCTISKTPTLCSPSDSPGGQRSIGRRTPTRSSAFFGSPSNHLFRTQSPYRKALRQNMKSQQETDMPQTGTRYLSSLSTLILPVRMPSPNNSDQNSSCASLESRYSCKTESVETERATRNSIMEDPPDSTDTFGEQPVEQEGPRQGIATTPTRHREVSAASSVEWKRWLSANVSKLETPPRNAKARLQSLIRAMPYKAGHVREDAEIDSPVAEGNISLTESPDVACAEEMEAQSAIEWQAPLNPMDVNAVSGRRRSSVTDKNLHPNTLRYKTTFSKEILPIAPLGIGLRAASSLPNVKNPRQAWSEKTGRVPLATSLFQSGSFASPGTEETGSSIINTKIHDTMSMKSSPGLTDAVEKPFGRVDFGHDYGLTLGKRFNWLDYNESWRENQDLNAQEIGSRRMVDLFLSSRQKRSDIPQSGETMTTAQSAFL